jgi:hypothetical protein
MADPTRCKNRKWARAGWLFTALGGFLALLVWRMLPPHREAATTPPMPAGAADSPQQRSRTAFEPSDWPLGPVALIYVAIPVLLLISCLVLIVAYPTAIRDVPRTLRIAPPGPRLQTDPAADLRRLRAAEEKQLNTYYWIDREKGIVHIPIEQAMRNLVKTGAPGFPKAQQ